MTKLFIPRSELEHLLNVLKTLGYSTIAPQVKQDAIVFDFIEGVEQLPWGVEQETAPGRYQLHHTDKQRCFSWNTGPQLFKPWLFQPTQTLWTGVETEHGITFKPAQQDVQKLAFIGARSCDIAALYLHDQHFIHGPYADEHYARQRSQICIVAVNCSQSTQTCFCTSTGDGPEATYGYDVLLDELEEGYLISAKSPTGNEIIEKLATQQAKQTHLSMAQQQLANAANQQRQMPTSEDLQKLTQHLSDDQWDKIAERCLACGNCTSVCPTCFCSKQESETDVETGEHGQVRYWDSCFSEQHAYISGKPIRTAISQHYRQWVLHKLANWQVQYGRSGCVGCGRCIDWCPAAIDLVEEVNLMLGGEAHD
ncbi:4Fe-4S dicluster domain-containing protein [Alteromonas facilis]|uniref:4Fe-4S dicluster domain-containing protein n=1 Tax=Alteromonas facilis TaxID=2048004 RepID=UPI000C29033D|nr:4Fe-4S dicluster domain-containing protein [Alteromonas facilis]